MDALIQGTEHEYTLYCRKMNSLGLDPHALGLELLGESDLHLAGEFLVNGSRAYYDVGHLELSTCEVTNPRDLVIWEKAGEKIVDWVRKIMEEKYLAEGGRISAFKNNTSPDGTSYGSHENYCVSRKLRFPRDFLEELVPHLTTRFIYTGAGDVLQGKYVLSPSAFLTARLVSGETMHDTGVLNTRDEPHAHGGLRRLHLQIGDALMGEVPILLRHFTTASVVRLMEQGSLGGIPKMESPVEDMWHNVERTNPDDWVVHLAGGEKASPIDVQRAYLEAIEEVVETPEEVKALKLLEEVLDGLESKSSRSLARRVEWLDRWFAIQERSEGRDSPDMEMMACKQYSELGEERSLHYRRLREGKVDRVVEDDEILRAVKDPPSDTRAHLRRELCDGHQVESIDWARVVINDGTRRRIDLGDPYATELTDYVAA
jgi:proteasome accessory factor A